MKKVIGFVAGVWVWTMVYLVWIDIDKWVPALNNAFNHTDTPVRWCVNIAIGATMMAVAHFSRRENGGAFIHVWHVVFITLSFASGVIASEMLWHWDKAGPKIMDRLTPELLAGMMIVVAAAVPLLKDDIKK